MGYSGCACDICEACPYMADDGGLCFDCEEGIHVYHRAEDDRS